MAEESRSGGRSEGRNRRRRYYKRKSGGQQGVNAGGQETQGIVAPGDSADASGQPANQHGARGSGGQGSQPQGQQRSQKGSANPPHDSNLASASTVEGRTRGVRKRRRSRSRRGDFRPETPLPTEKDQEYIAPRSVYVYTHVARPSSRESYEFRSEHFSRVGHTLDDYTVDLSIIFDVPRPNFGVEVARAYADMEAAGDIATEARFQPWVEYLDGEKRPAPSPGVDTAGPEDAASHQNARAEDIGGSG